MFAKTLFWTVAVAGVLVAVPLPWTQLLSIPATCLLGAIAYAK